MWCAGCWVRKGCEDLQWGDLSPWTSMSPGTPGEPCRAALVCIYEICFLQVSMNEWELGFVDHIGCKRFHVFIRGAQERWSRLDSKFGWIYGRLSILGSASLLSGISGTYRVRSLKDKRRGHQQIYIYLEISDSIKCWEGSIVPAFEWQEINVIQKVRTQLIWPPN